MKIWFCKIGETDPANVPPGADSPMRDAIAAAYQEITGQEPVFIFSGWGAELTEGERAAAEDRLPNQLAAVLEDVRDAEGRLKIVLELAHAAAQQPQATGPDFDHWTIEAVGWAEQARMALEALREELEDDPVDGGVLEPGTRRVG